MKVIEQIETFQILTADSIGE